MVVVIHQPHYMPWLGYLHRMAQADLFVVLDHVQFEKQNYQNRTRIRLEGAAHWLTVPVVQASWKERIVDKMIDNRHVGAPRWAPRHFAILQRAYREAGFFSHYAPALKRIYEGGWERLVELNSVMLEVLRDVFGIRTPLARSSELGVEGAKSDLVLGICRAVGADTLLAGLGGSRRYLDAEAFARSGVQIRFHEFEHPLYQQCGTAPFIPGLSALDLLFNCGPRSRGILLGEAATHEPRAAA